VGGAEVLDPRLGEDAGVDPGGAGGGAVVLEGGEARQVLLLVAGHVAVDLPHDLGGARLVLDRPRRDFLLIGLVVPDEVLDARIAGVGGILVEFLQAQAEVVGEPEVRSGRRPAGRRP
jgi:hypothetical protein